MRVFTTSARANPEPVEVRVTPALAVVGKLNSAGRAPFHQLKRSACVAHPAGWKAPPAVARLHS